METKQKDFENLVLKYKSTVYTVCYMFSKDNDEVNDMFQESLLNLWKGFETFKGKSDLRTWIWKVSLNTCISFDRKKKKLPTVPLSMDIDLYEDKDNDTRQIKMLYDRINRLKPFDKAIILLWLENMSYDEIGLIIGISPKNVSIRLVRIREELKNMSNN